MNLTLSETLKTGFVATRPILFVSHFLHSITVWHLLVFKYFFTEFGTAETGLACGHGFTTSNDNKCIYSLDMYGHIKGCRSLQHLQDCGKYLTSPKNSIREPQVSTIKWLNLSTLIKLFTS